jgi:hypothetical protein
MTEGKRGELLSKKLLLPWPLLFSFLLLTIAIAVSGYLFYQKQKQDVFHE